jgi:hypothetical protein
MNHPEPNPQRMGLGKHDVALARVQNRHHDRLGLHWWWASCIRRVRQLAGTGLMALPMAAQALHREGACHGDVIRT